MKHYLRTLLIGSFLSAVFQSVSLAQFYTPDPTFQSVLVKRNQASVGQIVVQPDQKILVNGGIDYINNTRVRGLIRLLPDGNIDPSFHLSDGFYGSSMVTLRPDGKIYTTGLYFNENGEQVFKLFLLNPDGRLDSTFQTNIHCDYVSDKALARQLDGKLLIGGNTYAAGTYKSTLNRLYPDGRTDATFNTGTLQITWISLVTVQPDGKIIVVGDIKSPVNGAPLSIIRLNPDGSVDEGFATYYNRIYAVQVQPDGKLLLGMGGSYANDGNAAIIRVNADGSPDDTFQPSGLVEPMNVYSIALQADGKILLGKWFRDSIAGRYGRGQVVRLHSNGKYDATFNAGQGASQAIFCLAVQADNKVLAGGFFETYTYNDSKRTGLVRLNGNNGSLDTGFMTKAETSGNIFTVSQQTDGKLLVGGAFHTANNAAQKYLMRLHPNGSVDTTFQIGTSIDSSGNYTEGSINTIKVQSDNKILVGGVFTYFNGQKRIALVRLLADGTTDPSFQSSLVGDYQVTDIALQADQKIVIAGSDPFINGAQRKLIRLLADGREDLTFQTGTGFEGFVQRIVVQPDGKIVASGSFTSYNGVNAKNLIRLNSDGSVDASFKAAEAENNVDLLKLLPDGKLLAGGLFQVTNHPVTNTLRNRFVRLNANGSIDTTFKFELATYDYVRDVVVQADGKTLLTGTFNSLGMPVIRLNRDGSRDSTFWAFESQNYYSNLLVVTSEGHILLSAGDNLRRLTSATPQTITFEAIPDKLTADSPFTLSATASSGLEVSFAVVSGPATIAGNTVTLTGEPGAVTVRASQAGNATYLPAPEVERTFNVNKVLGWAEESGSQVSLHPNPSIGRFVVSMPAGWQVEAMYLYDRLGKPVPMSFSPVRSGYQVEAKQTTWGVYLLHIYTNQGKTVKKVVMQPSMLTQQR